MNSRNIFNFFVIGASFAAAEMCQEFCFNELGYELCAGRTWCKDNYDCHNLFWTDASRTRICVIDEYVGCTNEFPVMCDQASSNLDVHPEDVYDRAHVELPFIPSNICEDFCFRELGYEMCAGRTWCKDNYDCHNLFWNNAERRRICVLDNYPGCMNTYPVLCGEVSDRVGPRSEFVGESTTVEPTVSE